MQENIEGKKNCPLFLFDFGPHLLGDQSHLQAQSLDCPPFVVYKFFWRLLQVSKWVYELESYVGCALFVLAGGMYLGIEPFCATPRFQFLLPGLDSELPQVSRRLLLKVLHWAPVVSRSGMKSRELWG